MRVCPQCFSTFRRSQARCSIDGAFLEERDNDPLIGTIVDGRYRVLEALGRGGMATVYHARHHTLDREYALKVLAGDVGSHQRAVDRFRREARWVSRMRHPNIVAVHDFGTTASGLTFLAMEHVSGRNLRVLINEEVFLQPARAAMITREIALGLQEAHHTGLVHRDLKPSNVMVSSDCVKLLDFGLVGLTDALEPPEEEPEITQEGLVIGTPKYMAPEQALGASVGPAADLYSLGILLYEMLVGQPPFLANSITQMLVDHAIKPPPKLPPSQGLELLVEWLLQKQPQDRPRSAQEVLRFLDQHRLGLRPQVSQEAATVELPPPKPSRPRLGEMLIEGGYISDAQLEEALEVQKRTHRKLGATLVKMGALQQAHLTRVMCRHFEMGEWNTGQPIHPRVLELLPNAWIQTHTILPVALRQGTPKNTLFLATSEPPESAVLNELQVLTEDAYLIGWLLCPESELLKVISERVPSP